ncbi:DUF1344 domain-containing protein [Hoeflea olei]|uniref:DUF1344 domain-containing protein n=1 Tax=Hoeflea olei TaxID=1480615 RepID=A0A1C1YV54_9HYPH|nr:DUF1344 domain-containing protein [Hoeflea olei]OCW57286.1 hypothetical protein AWJ14_13995 [Hoeflea olei]
MKKIAAIVLASAAMISTAFAGEIQGVVKAVDADTATVELESGEVFTLAEGVVLQGIEAGTTVKVVFTDGTTEATEVSAVQ